MKDFDFLKRYEANLLAQWDKQLALRIQIENLESELKEFTKIQEKTKDKTRHTYTRLELSVTGLKNRIQRLKKQLYNI